MGEVICLDLPAGAEYLERVRRAWDEGDAVFPLDPRLPTPARDSILDAVRPTVIVSPAGERRVGDEGCDDGDALLVATSGTSGPPRIAVLTRHALQAGAEAVAERLQITRDDKWFACLPLAHVGGFSVLARSLLLGTPVTVVERFSEESFLDASRRGCTLTSLVPAALSRVDPSVYRVILLGGSAPPRDRPANVVATYGMSESGGGVVYDGRPLAGVEVSVDADGQILLRCPMLLRTYRDGTVPITPDGWYPTGDLGRMSPDGTLSVDGRRDDRIVTGGEKVWPTVVEDVLRTHPAVEDVCVAGVDDPEWGQAVHVWIVPSPGGNPTVDDLRAHVKETLPAYCAPKVLHLTTEIPRTTLGKPRRAVLAATATKR